MDLPSYEKHVAECIRVTSQDILSKHTLLDGKCETTVHLDYMLRGLAIRLESYMLAEKRDTIEIHESWPTTWWDAFKERWFPRWLKKRFPVEYHLIDIDQLIYGPVCPHLHIPERDKHLRWMSYEGPLV